MSCHRNKSHASSQQRMIAMIVAIGWDIKMKMQRIACVIASTMCVVNIAHSASKIVVKRENDKTITIETRDVVRNAFDTMIKRSRDVAHANACASQNKFEILNARDDETRCVGIDR